MQVTETERYVGPSGDPIEELTVLGSRFDQIAIRRTSDGIQLRAHEAGHGDDAVITINTRLTDELYKGVELTDTRQRRRDIDDDLLDALHQVGYCVVDTDLGV